MSLNIINYFVNELQFGSTYKISLKFLQQQSLPMELKDSYARPPGISILTWTGLIAVFV